MIAGLFLLRRLVFGPTGRVIAWCGNGLLPRFGYVMRVGYVVRVGTPPGAGHRGTCPGAGLPNTMTSCAAGPRSISTLASMAMGGVVRQSPPYRVGSRPRS